MINFKIFLELPNIINFYFWCIIHHCGPCNLVALNYGCIFILFWEELPKSNFFPIRIDMNIWDSYFLPRASFSKTYKTVNYKQNKNLILMVKSVLFFLVFFLFYYEVLKSSTFVPLGLVRFLLCLYENIHENDKLL